MIESLVVSVCGSCKAWGGSEGTVVIEREGGEVGANEWE